MFEKTAFRLLLEETVPAAVFRSEIAAWSRQLAVEPRQVRIRSMKRKWASCSSNGRLTFDSDLLRQPAAFRREVAIHELLHLKIPNHGKLFRSLLRAHLSGETGSADTRDS